MLLAITFAAIAFAAIAVVAIAFAAIAFAARVVHLGSSHCIARGVAFRRLEWRVDMRCALGRCEADLLKLHSCCACTVWRRVRRACLLITELSRESRVSW